MLNSYASIRGASSFGLSYPKIYIDGIEVANPLLISRFAPEAIDRIEVIRGPQGSALYGADAISGVVNIVTRHEGLDADGLSRVGPLDCRTHAEARLRGGVLSQEHALSIVTGSSTRSADLHIIGRQHRRFHSERLQPRPRGQRKRSRGWRTRRRSAGPRASSRRTLAARAVRCSRRPLTTPVDPSTGDAINPSLAPQSIQEYTLGATATSRRDDRWTHSVVAGIDGYRLANVETNSLPIPTVADSALRAAQGRRRSRQPFARAAYFTFAVTIRRTPTLTFSAEHSELRESVGTTTPVVSLGGRTLSSRTATSTVVAWQNEHGAHDPGERGDWTMRCSLTGGVRLERDSRLAGLTEVVALPMLGLRPRWRDFGPVTVKLRGAYGEGIRPAVDVRPRAVRADCLWLEQRSQRLAPNVRRGPKRGSISCIPPSPCRFGHAIRSARVRIDSAGRDSSRLEPPVAPHALRARERRRDLESRMGDGGGTELSRLSVTGTLSFVDSRVAEAGNRTTTAT